MIGNRYECQCCGRIARVTGEYHDDGDTGYEYVFENDEAETGRPLRRWISTHAASIRFKRVGDDAATVRQALCHVER